MVNYPNLLNKSDITITIYLCFSSRSEHYGREETRGDREVLQGGKFCRTHLHCGSNRKPSR